VVRVEWSAEGHASDGNSIHTVGANRSSPAKHAESRVNRKKLGLEISECYSRFSLIRFALLSTFSRWEKGLLDALIVHNLVRPL
jgi:hypothetical protein